MTRLVWMPDGGRSPGTRPGPARPASARTPRRRWRTRPSPGGWSCRGSRGRMEGRMAWRVVVPSSKRSRSRSTSVRGPAAPVRSMPVHLQLVLQGEGGARGHAHVDARHPGDAPQVVGRAVNHLADEVQAPVGRKGNDREPGGAEARVELPLHPVLRLALRQVRAQPEGVGRVVRPCPSIVKRQGPAQEVRAGCTRSWPADRWRWRSPPPGSAWRRGARPGPPGTSFVSWGASGSCSRRLTERKTPVSSSADWLRAAASGS